MNKLLPALMLCAFALVQVPAHAQTAKPAAPAASAAKADEKQAAKPAEKETRKSPRRRKRRAAAELVGPGPALSSSGHRQVQSPTLEEQE